MRLQFLSYFLRHDSARRIATSTSARSAKMWWKRPNNAIQKRPEAGVCRLCSSSVPTLQDADAPTSAMDPSTEKKVPIIFVEADGTEKEVQAPIGKHLLDVAHENNVELEGACGGELACSTCHLIFEQDIYDKLPEKLDDEDDMLDLAFEVTDTSRLGCQIHVAEYMAGMKVRIPDDGF